jgi:tetratricopeptide (TPR) repeat protein
MDGASVCQSCWQKTAGRTTLVDEQKPVSSESRPPVNVTLAGLVRKYLKDRVRAVELRMRASEALATAQEDTALEIYTEALQLAADDPVTLIQRSEVLALKGQLTDALQDVNMALRLVPQQSKILYNKGQILDGLNRKEESLASYLTCLVINKDKDVREHVLKALSQYVSTEDEKQLTEQAFQRLCRILYLTREELSMKPVPSMINIDNNLAREDFDCLLCCKLLYKPITAPCGHTFCQECLNRSLDYRPTCPACRGSLAEVR